MTRKHYIALAAALRSTRPDPEATPDRAATIGYQNGLVRAWMDTVRAVADALAADNGRFDRQRFYAAAGIDR